MYRIMKEGEGKREKEKERDEWNEKFTLIKGQKFVKQRAHERASAMYRVYALTVDQYPPHHPFTSAWMNFAFYTLLAFGMLEIVHGT